MNTNSHMRSNVYNEVQSVTIVDSKVNGPNGPLAQREVFGFNTKGHTIAVLTFREGWKYWKLKGHSMSCIAFILNDDRMDSARILNIHGYQPYA